MMVRRRENKMVMEVTKSIERRNIFMMMMRRRRFG